MFHFPHTLINIPCPFFIHLCSKLFYPLMFQVVISRVSFFCLFFFIDLLSSFSKISFFLLNFVLLSPFILFHFFSSFRFICLILFPFVSSFLSSHIISFHPILFISSHRFLSFHFIFFVLFYYVDL